VSSALRQRDVAAGVDARAQPRSLTPALRTARAPSGDDETHGDVVFESLHTLRRNVIQRAARLTRPQGKWTLTLPDIPSLRASLLCCTA